MDRHLPWHDSRRGEPGDHPRQSLHASAGPTGGDFATSCGLLVAAGVVLVVLLAGVVLVVLLAGLACSIAGIVVARKRGLALAGSAVALCLNLLPVALAFAYDLLFTRGLL